MTDPVALSEMVLPLASGLLLLWVFWAVRTARLVSKAVRPPVRATARETERQRLVREALDELNELDPVSEGKP